MITQSLSLEKVVFFLNRGVFIEIAGVSEAKQAPNRNCNINFDAQRGCHTLPFDQLSNLSIQSGLNFFYLT
jgi:hypothetical protein